MLRPNFPANKSHPRKNIRSLAPQNINSLQRFSVPRSPHLRSYPRVQRKSRRLTRNYCPSGSHPEADPSADRKNRTTPILRIYTKAHSPRYAEHPPTSPRPLRSLGRIHFPVNNAHVDGVCRVGFRKIIRAERADG
jgi:hypothetical protein